MADDAPIRLLDRTVDPRQGVVSRDGAEVARLTTKELQLLAFLVQRPGEVVPREVLLDQVWGYRPATLTRAVDNMMRKLRVKIEADPAQPVHLITVYGEGYRFDPVATPAAEPVRPVAPTVIGRDALVDELVQRLDAGVRCLTLHGPAGIGKTTVATALAERVAAGGRTVWWCAADAVRDGEGLSQAVTTAVGAAEGGLDDALATPGLLVLDGGDQLGPEVDAQLAAWLQQAPGLQVVATSRVRCLAEVAAAVEVPPLDREHGLALVLDHARRVRPDADSEALVALAERLQGWPLAVELACARLRVLSPADVLERLEQGLGVLRDPRGGTALDAVITEALDGLDPDDHAVLLGCTVFEGPFRVADADAVCGRDTLDALHRLADCSLLRSEPGGRLSWLDTIRAAAAARLDAQARRQLEHAHLQHFVAVAEGPWRVPVAQGWARARAAMPDVEAAFERALATDPDAAARIALVLQHELSLRGHQARRRQRIAQARAARPSPVLDLALQRAELMTKLGTGGGVPEAELAQLAEEARQLDAPDEVCRALLARAQCLRRLGRLPDAEHVARRALDALPPDANPATAVLAPLVLGSVVMDQGRAAEAMEGLEAGIGTARRLGDRAGEGQLLWTQGMVQVVVCRDPDAAEPYLRRAIARAAAHGPRVWMDAHLLLAQVAVDRGDVAEARRLVAELWPRVRRFGELERLSALHNTEAEIAIEAGDFDAAERHLQAHLDLFRRRGVSFDHYLEGNLGMVYRVSDRPRLALATLERARSRALERGAAQVAAVVSGELACTRAQLGDLEGAEADLARAPQSGPDVRVARAHVALARGERDEAVAIRDALAAAPVRSVGLRAALRHLNRCLARDA